MWCIAALQVIAYLKQERQQLLQTKEEPHQLIRGKYWAYIKQAENIMDVLSLIGTILSLALMVTDRDGDEMFFRSVASVTVLLLHLKLALLLKGVDALMTTSTVIYENLKDMPDFVALLIVVVSGCVQLHPPVHRPHLTSAS